MGEKSYIQKARRIGLRARGRFHEGWAFALALAVVVVVTPADVRADAPEPDPSVSTSPVAARFGAPRGADPRASKRPEATPLTRAAARRHVESITPERWLSRFGRVDVARRR